MERYESQVAATVCGMLGRCDEADDVGQETFVRFYGALGKFRGDSGVGTYLTRIAMNLSLNALKRRKKQRERFAPDGSDKLEDIADPAGPSREEWEQKDAVYKALQKLDPDFRAVVVLRLMDGYSTQETAQALNLPLGTVLSRLSRAQAKLRDILTNTLGDENGKESSRSALQVA